MTQPGLRADFHVALAATTAAAARLATLARSLPDNEEGQRLRHEVGILTLRLANLEALALRWPA